MRSAVAAARRAEREAARQQRAAAKAYKLQQKLSAIEQAVAEAEAYQARIRELTTIHHEAEPPIDWESVKSLPEPTAPTRNSASEDAARADLARFTPSFFQKVFGLAEKARAAKELAVAVARSEDDKRHASTVREYETALFQWREKQEMAAAILSGDIALMKEAVDALDPLGELAEMECATGITFADSKTAVVALSVGAEKIVPEEAKSVTQSGKLSVKAVPRAKICETYREYVCGCSLRAGRELLGCLPISCVVVNVSAPMLDSVTGHIASQTVLSVAMPRDTMERINFSGANPTDSMRLFTHRMKYTRSGAFSPVSELRPTEYPTR